MREKRKQSLLTYMLLLGLFIYCHARCKDAIKDSGIGQVPGGLR